MPSSSPVIPHGVQLPEDLSANVTGGWGVVQALMGPLVDQQVVLLVEGALAVATFVRVRVGLGGLPRPGIVSAPTAYWVTCMLINSALTSSARLWPPPCLAGERRTLPIN